MFGVSFSAIRVFKSCSLLLVAIFWPLVMLGQPPICTPPPTMTPLCADACVICDIDGFNGTNDGFPGVTGEAPSDFCTTVVHNARWIAFVAGSNTLSIDFAVSNCQVGRGLELAIYESTDCQNFTLVSNCRGSGNRITPGTTGTITTNVPLVVGQYYYIVMDGSMADICDWNFSVVQGSTQVNALQTTGPIMGPDTMCPNLTAEYFVNPQVGAWQFEWTLDGTSLGLGDTMDISFPNFGTYDLCATASNICDTASPFCRTIVIDTIPKKIIDEVLCFGDSLVVNDTITLKTSGTYEYDFTTQFGCDSALQVNLVVNPPAMSSFNVSICDSDTIYIGETPYFETGMYTQVITTANGCDSTIDLDLSVITCNLIANFEVVPTRCAGESNGSINFHLANGVAPYSYVWEEFGGGLSGNGTVNNTNQQETISGLYRATYLVTITDQTGGIRILIADVEDPDTLGVNLVLKDYNGPNISCNGAFDGEITAQPFGGIPPYTFNWSNGMVSNPGFDFPAGIHSVTVRDSNGCETTASDTLIEPDLLTFLVKPTDPGCDGPESGFLVIDTAIGGTPPYFYSYLEDSALTNPRIEGLVEGEHTVGITDTNGCQADTTFTLVATVLPVIDLGLDTTVMLGDEAFLDFTFNVPITSVRWEPDSGLSCNDCFSTIAIAPGTTTYWAYVVSEDGCETQDFITINTEPRRTVWIPNAFTPDGDGRNDFFNLHGGSEIATVRSLKIHSRWGELIYNGSQIPPGNGHGWDGKVKGQEAQHGVYSYIAWVDFIDGISLVYTGRVSLIR